MDEDREQFEHFEYPEHSSDETLSDEDRAILEAFEAADIGNDGEAESSATGQEEISREDLLALFTDEMEEDITKMRLALSQVEGDALDEGRFDTIRRHAHKIRGTAGAMDCVSMSKIAQHIEEVVAQITTEAVPPLIGLNVLVQAVLALEFTLQGLHEQGVESDTPLRALEQELEQFSLLGEPQEREHNSSPLISEHTPTYQSWQGTQESQDYRPLPQGVSIESQRFERLLRLSEQLAEARVPLENAQEQVDSALQELHTAQRRLQQLERTLTDLTSITARRSHRTTRMPASSLVEHMLKGDGDTGSESISHDSSSRRRHPVSRDEETQEQAEWDALEVDRYNERDRTVAELRDAIATVTITTARVQRANEKLRETTQQYLSRTSTMHSHLSQLRIVPLSLLVPHLRHMLETHSPQANFEITGEKTEVDQDVLDKLVVPLTTLLHTCIVATHQQRKTSTQEHIWFHAQAHGNDVTLEIGFSMAVQGGAFETLQPYLQQIQGTIELVRNDRGGVSFLLHFPRSQGTIRGLLVRVGKQRVVLPFSQVQCIGDERSQRVDIVYHLYKLLNSPQELHTETHALPLVILPQGRSRITAGVFVDEILTDITALVKPLPPYLRRPGITGTVLDGKGQLLLLLDIPTLVKHYTASRRHELPGESSSTRPATSQRTILIADDSRVLRKSLTQVLAQAHYATIEASDGLEALEMLTSNVPDVFLLDMEMPNLNGYDLLSIVHIYPELSDMKIIMLTSRTTEKHKQRARELGAHDYLTKPCSNELLLETIERVLG